MVAPGVTVNATGRAGLTSSVSNPAGRAFMVGVCERGPVDKAVRTQSIAQFETIYGTRQSYGGALYDGARSYFEEGGPELWIARVVGATATVGAVTLMDRATAPLPTLKVAALNPGTWSTELSVSVTPGSVAGVTLTVFRSGAVVETWRDLVDVPAIVAALNGTSGTAASTYVAATNLASTSTGATALPALVAATALTGGDANRSTVTAATVTAALSKFPAGLGVGAVMAPGYPADLVGADLKAHAAATGRIALLSGPIDAGPNQLIALAASIVGVNSKFAGLFGPWVTIPDGSSVRTIDPVGAVAGRRARTINNDGFWVMPAGEINGKFRFVTGTAWVLDETTNGALAAAGVSGIVTYPSGPQLFGWFALASDGAGNMALLSNQDSLNSLTGGIQDLLHKYVWRTVDGTGGLFGEIHGDLEGFLAPLGKAGCFYARADPDGDEIDPGYSVTVDDTLNPATQLASNIVKAAVGVRFSPALVSLQVNIYESGLTAGV